MAEVFLFKEIDDDYPILLLDDIFSELDIKKRNRLFYQFCVQQLELGNEIQKAELGNLKRDAYIVGSDQVWNLQLTGNDETFFLDFVPEVIDQVASKFDKKDKKITEEDIDDMLDEAATQE